MQWNISQVKSVTNNNFEELIIIGFNPDKKNECLKSTITKTTLEDALDDKYNKHKKNQKDFHEGFGLSVVNRDLVYIIDVTFYTDEITYDLMKESPFIPVDEHKYSDGKYYLGLPHITFLMWKSMLKTNL
jgi:hypothetical protein